MIDRKLNLWMALCGLGGGVAGHFAGQALLDAVSMPRPVAAAAYMAVLGLCIVILCVLAETLFPVVNGVSWKRHYCLLTWKYLLPVVLVPMVFIGGILQGLYQADFSFSPARDVYMLLDRSGSMGWNDPNDERLNAVVRLLDGFDKADRVEILVFDEETDIVQGLTPVSDPAVRQTVAEQLALYGPRGGTDFNKILTLALARIQTHDATRRVPVVILLSDGESDIDADLLAQYAEGGIPINTVGLLLEATDGETVLSHIAAQTGGQFVWADGTDQLNPAFAQIYDKQDAFILRTRRGVDGLQWLLFALAGLCLGLATGFLFDNRYIIKPLAVGGVISGIVAGALLCQPVDLVWAAAVLGGLFTLFTVFAKTPPAPLAESGMRAGESLFSGPVAKSDGVHGRF